MRCARRIPPAAIAELEKYAKKKRIAIVGHEPGVGDRRAAGGMRREMEFKKGAIARIDVEALPPRDQARCAGSSRRSCCES
jgi:phosphohistidine phosphatase SixA